MSTKLIIGCISGASALGGVVTGSYYLLNKEPEKSEKANVKPQQLEQPARVTVTKNTKPLKELMGEAFVALNTTERNDDAHWKTLITKHKDSAVAGKIIIDGELEQSPTDDNLANIKKLQAACAKLLDKVDDISESDKETARNWCNQKSKLITGK